MESESAEEGADRCPVQVQWSGDYKAGLAIVEVELTAANIRDGDRRGFEINTPFKNFCLGCKKKAKNRGFVFLPGELGD
ncbi:hypothetical protein EYF80_026573 [Liparis tanakae]|uniref:Uncharacterized protein n=1 Tax=Liparis tanakae TaxID=230148 RepID=A0A4Z2HCJ2_9TELE|nr:hypothetical protein EYF80_026573 [Liparis tanakae]